MEQEGRPAPLAIPCDAEHAAEIRAAAFENRHGLPQPREGVHAPQGEDERRREEHRESRDQRDARGPRDQRPSRDGRDSRRPQPGGPREATQGQQPRQHPGERLQERGGGAERDPRKGRHDRNDRRRGGHSEERFEGGQENGRELPPPTPEELFPGEGLIEISGKGFGFLRDPLHNFAQNPADIFVSPELVRRYNLKDGHWIRGSVRRSGRGRQIHEIETVNGDAPESCRLQPAFEELTVINPSEPLKMETVSERYTTRVIDMIAPIGKGQRGLIVAQPRTGKTTLLQHIADAMMKNHPDVHLIMLLVDERPEEVTEIRHTVPKAEIMASSNDMDVRSHTRIAELAIERAKRLVESGRDVFILLDSITRLGRAFNNAMTNGGRTMSGGIDARAMEVPRRLFAAARNTEEAGSLTIIATALIDTGSRMDEIIFQEFKGTGNMELVLDRKIAEQRIYPAVDIFQSGTRREELLVPADLLQKIYFLRRGLSGAKPLDAIDRLLFYLRKFPTNEQMLREIKA
ncbi:MAG: transcription termination factor Rho [Verrucomicrobia bacterium]|nr:transcription termination factor Rho [Verrucomicrobiota bacterium]